jgi:phosphopantetheinyl transferase (holo-ACP synthase)
MQSTGNDIIALDSINKQRSNEAGFYRKILTDSELAIYHQSRFAGMPFENFLWLSWSIKESAYKYLKRKSPNLVFSPARVVMQHMDIPVSRQATVFESGQWQGTAAGGNCYRGTCILEDTILYFRSQIHPEMIATVVNDYAQFAHTWWGIRKIDHSDTEHQSKEVRSFLLQKLNIVLPGEDLRVEKTSVGYPVVLQGTKELKLPVSFSHHGRYIAYSFLFNPSAKVLFNLS